MAKPASRAFRGRGILGILVYAPVLVAALVCKPGLALAPPWLFVWEGCAWGLLCAGIFFRLSGIIFVGGRKGKSLVMDGPYSVSRNPIYLGSLCIGISASLFLHSLTLLGATMVMSVMYAALVIRAEELQLSEAFPEEWKGYASSVARVFPRRLWTHEAPSREVDLRALKNEAFRSAAALFIPWLAALLTHVRGQEWWPRLWTLP